MGWDWRTPRHAHWWKEKVQYFACYVCLSPCYSPQAASSDETEVLSLSITTRSDETQLCHVSLSGSTRNLFFFGLVGKGWGARLCWREAMKRWGAPKATPQHNHFPLCPSHKKWAFAQRMRLCHRIILLVYLYGPKRKRQQAPIANTHRLSQMQVMGVYVEKKRKSVWEKKKREKEWRGEWGWYVCMRFELLLLLCCNCCCCYCLLSSGATFRFFAFSIFFVFCSLRCLLSPPLPLSLSPHSLPYSTAPKFFGFCLFLENYFLSFDVRRLHSTFVCKVQSQWLHLHGRVRGKESWRSRVLPASRMIPKMMARCAIPLRLTK